MKHKHLIAFVLATSLLAPLACSHAPETVQPKHPENATQTVLFEQDAIEISPSGTQYAVFKGWTKKQEPNHIRLEAPENDVHISIIELKATDALDAVAKAWALHKPNTSIRSGDPTHYKAIDGWDEMMQANITINEQPETIVVANARKFNDTWFVYLLEGTQQSIIKRSAQSQTTFTSIKPKDFVEPQNNFELTNPIDPNLLQSLETYAESLKQNLDIPGFAIAIVQNDKILYEKAVGVTNLENPEPLTTDTRFLVGSVTKLFTGYMISSMVDAGVLQWDTSIQTLMPDFKTANPEFTTQLSLKNSLCACTGLPRKDMELVFNYAQQTPEEALKVFENLSPTTAMGEAFQYNNQLVALAGYLAAKKAYPSENLTQAYQKAMKKFVFEPLGMNNSSFEFEEVMAQKYASPHAYHLDFSVHPLPMEVDKFVLPIAPAGGLWTTTADMARYMQAEMRATSEAHLARRQKSVPMDAKSYYGLAMIVTNDNNTQFLSHDGQTFGASAHVLMHPDSQTGIAVFSNASHGASFNALVSSQFFSLVANQPAEEMEKVTTLTLEQLANVKQKRAVAMTERFQTKPDPEWVKKLEGTYEHPTLGNVTIYLQNDTPIFDVHDWKTPFARLENKEAQEDYILLMQPPLVGVPLKVLPNGLSLDAETTFIKK